MTDFGGKLRQARERRGISLRQIAASTKISVGALEALEHNDVTKLPGGIFSRAFVRSYASEVGLNPDDTVREFLDLFEQRQAEETTVPRPPLSDEESQFESAQEMAGVVLKLVFVAIPIAIVILYFTLRSKPPAPAPPVADAPAPSAPSNAARPLSSSPAPAEAAGGMPIPPALSSLATERQAPQEAKAGEEDETTLELHPTGSCWVSVTVDGRLALSKVMEAGDRERFVVKTEAIVEVGDAGAFAYSINGKDGLPLGTAGQVRTLRVTAASTPR
jgi:cytoskeletal protein RodZ